MSEKMSSQFRLGEVKLRVSELDRSIAYYEQVIGFKVLRKEDNIAYLTADGKTTLLILEEVEDAVVTPAQTASGLYHFAILLPSRTSLGSFLNHLAEQDVKLGQADHLVSEALYVYDPDNHGIEIYRDRPRDEWNYELDGHVKMASDPIDLESLMNDGKQEVWNGLPSDTIMGHVHLHVSDLMKSKAFYCDVLGFDIMANWPGAMFIAAGGYHHHLGMNTWAGVGAPLAPPNATGISYYKMIIPEADEIERTLKRLKQADIAVEQRQDAWYFQDPSGIEIKLSQQ